MPAYKFYDLATGPEEPQVTTLVLFNDLAAIRRAVAETFPLGCEVWQGQRFVGRFHRAQATRSDDPT